jgi:hypothetical protein
MTLRTFSFTVTAVPTSGFTPESGYSVSSSSGAYTRGSTVTITGTGFGTKPNGEKPRYFWRFDSNTSTDAALSRSAFAGSFRGTYQTTIKPSNRSGAMTWDIETGYPTSSNLFTGPDIRWTPASGAQFYLFLRRRAEYTPQGLATNGTQINNKILRLYPENVSGVSDDPSMYLGYASAPRTYCEGVDDGIAISGGPYWTVGQWHTLECQFQQGALDVKDGIFNCILNGRHYLSPSQRWYHRRTSAGETDRFDELNIDQRSNLIDVATPVVYYSDLMFDDSWCRVIHSTETAWNESTSGDYARKLAVVKTWTNTVITCELLDDMASGDRLYVVKSDGTALKIGSKD